MERPARLGFGVSGIVALALGPAGGVAFELLRVLVRLDPADRLNPIDIRHAAGDSRDVAVSLFEVTVGVR